MNQTLEIILEFPPTFTENPKKKHRAKTDGCRVPPSWFFEATHLKFSLPRSSLEGWPTWCDGRVTQNQRLTRVKVPLSIAP